jgi:hypothetical protein
MSTEKQIEANRANSQLSTGATTPQGKRTVSINAIKHGYAGRIAVVFEHEKEAYRAHFRAFREEYKPVGPTEAFLVESMADLTWSAQHIRSQMHNAMAIAGTRGPQASKDRDMEINIALAQGDNIHSLARELNLLGIYENRKMRLFNTTRAELLAIQQTRKLNETQALAEAARLRQADLATREPNEPEWEPTENGFVCSIQEIDLYIAREKRLARLNGGLKIAA